MTGYYYDFKSLTISKLKEKIKNTELLPSQKILLEKIDERFDLIKSQNINNLFELQEILKTKEKTKEFSRKTGLPEEYLIVLRREVNSYQAKSRKLSEFPSMKKEIIEKLAKKGIKDTGELFDFVATRKSREDLEKELNLSNDDVIVLSKLTDVSRLRYVGPNFATLLVSTEYDTVEKVQKADYNKLYESLININKKEEYYKGNIGLNDMKFFVNDANFFPLVVEY